MHHSAEEPIEFSFRAIGRIRTSFLHAPGTAIQSCYRQEEKATVEVFPQFCDGLKDLDGFERIWLVYYLDRAADAQMLVHPYLDNETRHGVFATRSPARPNPIGIAAVRLLEVHADSLLIQGVDMLDNTPLLDIKPYVPAFDAFETEQIGWYKNKLRSGTTADDRFQRTER